MRRGPPRRRDLLSIQALRFVVRDGALSDNPTYLAKRKRVYEGMRLAGAPEGWGLMVKSGKVQTEQMFSGLHGI